jgi:hypothetical protein
MDFIQSILGNETVIATVLGFVAVHVQSGKFKSFPRWFRYGVSLGACIVIALVASIVENLDSGGLHFDQVLKNMGNALIVSQTYYNTYFKSKLNAGV